MPKASKSLGDFLQARATKNNQDLIDRWSTSMELQCNVPAVGDPVEGKNHTYRINGFVTCNFRVPYHADSAPEWNDFEIQYPLDLCEAIGMSGWDWQNKVSKWVVFDIDAITHAAGLSDADLEKVKIAAQALPYIETRRSTGGFGLHLYSYLNDIPSENHTVHTLLARAILRLMSEATGFDFTGSIDVCGNIAWVYRNNQASNAFEIIKAATQTLSESDLPDNWRQSIEVVKRYQATVKTNLPEVPLSDMQMDVIEALSHTGYSTIWDSKLKLLQSHTKAFEEIAPQFNAEFKTNSDGKHPGTCNCWARLTKDGFKVFRYNPGTVEDESWNQDGTHWTTTYFIPSSNNPEPQTVIAECGGIKGDGVYSLTYSQAVEVVDRLCGRPLPTLEHPDRTLILKLQTTDLLFVTPRINSELPEGWVAKQRSLSVSLSLKWVEDKLKGVDVDAMLESKGLGNIEDAEKLARCLVDKFPKTFVLFQEVVHQYSKGVFYPRSTDSIKRRLRNIIMDKFHEWEQRLKEQGIVREAPSCSESLVNSVYGCFVSIIPEIETDTFPCYLDGAEGAKDILVMNNGNLNLITLELTEHDPNLFTFIKLPYDYLPGAECSILIPFLKTIWPDDDDSINLLQELFGYSLQYGNPMEIWILLQGASRAGKTILLDILCALLGRHNYCSIKMKNLNGQFALYAARAKLLIRIPDIQAPKNGLSSEQVETLKGISGLEPMEIEGKHRDATTDTLAGLIIASSNDFIDFADSSDALYNRLKVLKFTRSFLPINDPDHIPGQDQDPTLKERLKAELPAILNWALIGRKRLETNGDFTRPSSSEDLKKEMRVEGSPIKQFVKEWLDITPNGKADPENVFDRWSDWCQLHKYGDDVKGTPRSFGKLLRVACATVKYERQKVKEKDGSRPHVYVGINLRSVINDK